MLLSEWRTSSSSLSITAGENRLAVIDGLYSVLYQVVCVW